MEWTEALSVGVSEIDAQHKVLVDILNKLNTQIIHGQSLEATREALAGMRAYSLLHFRYEEGLMAETNYPGLEQHARLHRTFMERIDAFALEHEAGETQQARAEHAREVLSFLLDWLVDHILGADVIFSRHYQKRHTPR
jgi:hemerythrin-like metal-binding protein